MNNLSFPQFSPPAGRDWTPEEEKIISLFKEVHAHRDEFLKAFGAAMVAWGGVEVWLCFWLQRLSGLEYPVANRLYYATRSFSAKLDLLSGFVEQVPRTKEQEFAKEIIKKARQFSSFRNQMAHGLYSALTEDESRKIVLADPKRANTFLDLEDLHNIRRWFDFLTRSIRDMFYATSSAAAAENCRLADVLTEYCELVRSFPCEPTLNASPVCRIPHATFRS